MQHRHTSSRSAPEVTRRTFDTVQIADVYYQYHTKLRRRWDVVDTKYGISYSSVYDYREEPQPKYGATYMHVWQIGRVYIPNTIIEHLSEISDEWGWAFDQDRNLRIYFADRECLAQAKLEYCNYDWPLQ